MADDPRDAPRSAPGTILAGLAMPAIGAYVAWMGVEGFQAGSWPKADGQVESIKLLKNTTTGKSFKVEITYKYAVAGETYHGSRYNTRGDHVDTEDEIRRIGRAYRVGSPCSVSSNPLHPAHGFLDPQVTGYAYGRAAIGIPLAIAGLAVVASGARQIIRWWKANREPKDFV